MIRILLIAACIILWTGSISAQSKRRNKPRQTESPCGVVYTSEENLLDDLFDATGDDTRWRIITDSKKEYFYYDLQSIVCDQKSGILKAWVKVAPKDKTGKVAYSLQRLEIKCRSNQYRLTSNTDYDRDGDVIVSRRYDDEWDDAAPNTIGEKLIKAICHR